MVVGEFCEGDVLCPRSRVGTAEDSKIGFYLLVDTFSFSIGLQVISS